MDIKKPQLVKVEAFVNFFNGSFATPSQQHGNQQSECGRFEKRPYGRTGFCNNLYLLFLTRPSSHFSTHPVLTPLIDRFVEGAALREGLR